MPAGGRPLEVFISYSHKDSHLKEELIKHLSPLKRQGLVSHWHDRQIAPGADWAGEIDSKLESADVVLVLISPDFIHSDYCYEKEMLRAVERHDRGECRVIPVFLRACDWKGLAFGKIQGVPDDAIPVVSSSWGSQDEAFTRVAQGVRKIAEAQVQNADIRESRSRGIKERPMHVVNQPQVQTHRPKIGEVVDSGPGVLLNDEYFESESVSEEDGGRIVVRIAAQSATDESKLRALKGQPPFSGPVVSFAHGNEAFPAKVVSSRLASEVGKRVWSIELEPMRRPHEMFDDISVNGIRPDEIATARAELLLLGKEPNGKLEQAEMWIRNRVNHRGQREISTSVFPAIWLQSDGDTVKFLRWSRLVAVYALVTTQTCEHVLELSLRLEPSKNLFVKFLGSRHRSHGELRKIAVEGAVPMGSFEG